MLITLFVKVITDLRQVIEIFLQKNDSLGFCDFIQLQIGKNWFEYILARLKMFLVLVCLGSKEVVGSSNSLHVGLFYDPVSIVFGDNKLLLRCKRRVSVSLSWFTLFQRELRTISFLLFEIFLLSWLHISIDVWLGLFVEHFFLLLSLTRFPL